MHQDMTQKCEKKDVARVRKTFIHRQVYCLGVSTACMFAAFAGVLCLQSSINVAEELGTTTLAVAYGTTVAWNLLATSTMLKVLGPKKSILVGDFFYLAYTLANIYPSFAALVPASILLGIAQSVTWSSFPLFTGHFGKQYAIVKRREGKADHKNATTAEEDYTCRFAGLFFSIESGYLIFGNLTSYAILRFFQSEPSKLSGNDSLSYMFGTNNTANSTQKLCGAYQCSFKEDMTSNDSQKYEIQDWETRIWLFLGFAFMQLIAIGMHVFLLHDPSSYNWELAFHEAKDFEKELTVDEQCSSISVDLSDTKICNPPHHIKECGNGVLATLRQLTVVQQLLVVPFNLCNGMIMAFIFGDITRSYISCLTSVVQVGLVMSVFGFTEIIASFVFNRFVAKVGRNVFMVLACLLDGAALVFSLLWYPDTNEVWVPYLLVVFFGISDGLRQCLVIVTYVQYFRDNGAEAAYSCMSLFTGVGSALMYIFSQFMCVNVKIITLLVVLLIGCSCYLAAELRHRRNKSRSLIQY